MLKLFSLLSVADWVTPAIGFFEDLINDPTPFQSNSWTFFIPYEACLDAGYNARMVKRLMSEHDIKTWGSQITGGAFFFSVPKSQASWAEYILECNSIPISPESRGALNNDDE